MLLKGAYGSKDCGTLRNACQKTGEQTYPESATPDRSNPRTDVGQEVSIDPVDGSGIDISHLEQRWDFGVSCTTIHPDRISHDYFLNRARQAT